MDEWDLAPGDELTRAERRRRFGGAEYGGIEPSRTSGSIFVYTDPAVGAQHGYDYDGWVENDTVFQYTGKGREGDQTLTDRNRTLVEHEERALRVRVFAANGVVAGSSTKRQIYLGEFAVDKDSPFRQGDALDKNDDVRSVIVFRLLPVGDVLIRPQDRCTGASLSDTVTTGRELGDDVQVDKVEVEDQHSSSFERRPLESTTGQRREAELVLRYKEYLLSKGHLVTSRSVRLPGQSHPQRTDLYDDSTHELCEAKASASRRDIRYAVGQLLDYGRHVQHKTLSVLVPVRPSDDLVALLHMYGMACVYEDQAQFVRLSPHLVRPDSNPQASNP